MSPVLAERAEATTQDWANLRRHLSDTEWEKFNFEVFETRNEPPEVFKHLLESWLITIAMRRHPEYPSQFEGFMAALRNIA